MESEIKHMYHGDSNADCVVCEMFNYLEDTSSDESVILDGAGRGLDHRPWYVEEVPIKFLTGWMTVHLSRDMKDSVFSVPCPSCNKTFREFLIAEHEKCPHCEKVFAPLIRAVWKTVKKTRLLSTFSTSTVKI